MTTPYYLEIGRVFNRTLTWPKENILTQTSNLDCFRLLLEWSVEVRTPRVAWVFRRTAAARRSGAGGALQRVTWPTPSWSTIQIRVLQVWFRVSVSWTLAVASLSVLFINPLVACRFRVVLSRLQTLFDSVKSQTRSPAKMSSEVADAKKNDAATENNQVIGDRNVLARKRGNGRRGHWKPLATRCVPAP